MRVHSSIAAHLPTIAPGLSHLDRRWEGIRDQRHGDDRSRQQADRCGHGELEPVVFTHGAQLQVYSSVMAPAEADTHPPFGVMLIAVKQPEASKPQASAAPQAGGLVVMRSRPATKQTSKGGDSNMGITRSY